MKITHHRTNVGIILLSAVVAVIALVISRAGGESYVLVVFGSVASLVFLRIVERNSRLARSSARQQKELIETLQHLKIAQESQSVALAGLRSVQHSNELRIRRLGDWSKISTASAQDALGLLRIGAEKMERANLTLKDLMRMFNGLKSDQHSNEMRLRRLNESVKSISDDATKILADSSSSELRLSRLSEAVGSISEKFQKSDANQHSNEMRLRRLVDMNRRIDEKIVEFAELISSQNDIQYKSDALVKYQLLEGIFAIKNNVEKKIDN